jgi:hypothetical protein
MIAKRQIKMGKWTFTPTKETKGGKRKVETIFSSILALENKVAWFYLKMWVQIEHHKKGNLGSCDL